MFASRIATSGFRAIDRDGYARGREAILCAITPHATITAGAETPAMPQAMASELNASMSGSRLAVFSPPCISSPPNCAET